MKVTAEFDLKSIKAFGKDVDNLLVDIAKETSSKSAMRPIVGKIKQGMEENAMKFRNSEIWEKTKQAAKHEKIIDFDSPLMTTGQLVKDFKFYSESTKIRAVLKSNDFIVGWFSWDDKPRERPTYRHVLNQLAKAKGGVTIYDDIQEYTIMGSNELVKIIMRSPRYPIMDSIVSLYQRDIELHMERRINEAFNKK